MSLDKSKLLWALVASVNRGDWAKMNFAAASNPKIQSPAESREAALAEGALNPAGRRRPRPAPRRRGGESLGPREPRCPDSPASAERSFLETEAGSEPARPLRRAREHGILFLSENLDLLPQPRPPLEGCGQAHVHQQPGLTARCLSPRRREKEKAASAV